MIILFIIIYYYSSNIKKIEEKKKKPDKVNKTTKTDKEIEDEKRYKLKEKLVKKILNKKKFQNLTNFKKNIKKICE